MTKKQIKQLAKASYAKNNLSEKMVTEIAEKLDRKTLKAYIRELRAIEKEKNVIIATPSAKSYNTNRKLFENLFADKNIIAQEDSSILLGLRVTNNDMIYEKSLRQTIENLQADIVKNYN